MKKKLYLLHIEGDIEPNIIGPFATDRDRLSKAREIRLVQGEDYDGMFRLNCVAGTTIGTFSGAELNVEDDE